MKNSSLRWITPLATGIAVLMGGFNLWDRAGQSAVQRYRMDRLEGDLSKLSDKFETFVLSYMADKELQAIRRGSATEQSPLTLSDSVIVNFIKLMPPQCLQALLTVAIQDTLPENSDLIHEIIGIFSIDDLATYAKRFKTDTGEVIVWCKIIVYRSYEVGPLNWLKSEGMDPKIFVTRYDKPCRSTPRPVKKKALDIRDKLGMP